MTEQTKAGKSVSVLVKEAFLKLLPVQIAGIIVGAINTFVDSVVTGQFLGTEAMAAIGFFGPVATVIGISYVLIIGIQILCGRHIGAGEGAEVVSLFSTGAVFLGAFSIAISAICLLFRQPLAELLGARGHTAELLSDYITGYAPGIIGQVLSGMLMFFLPLNNDMKRSYIGIGTMVVSNIAMDLLAVAVLHLGVLGMGIATAVSYLFSAAVMFAGFTGRDRVIRFRFGNFCFRRLPKAALLGLPNLMFTIGCTAKAYVMNLTLMSSVGDAAVAAMNVQGNVCSILGAIPMGCANAFLTLGSMYYGDEDRQSLLDLIRYALRTGVALSAAAMLLLMLGSGLIPSLFYPPADEAWHVTRRMLLLFPSFLVFNTIFNLFLKAYQIQERMGLVNVLSVAENLIMAFFAAGMAGLLGADAVWLAFPFSEIVCILVIAVSVMLRAGKLTFSLPDWMKLSRDFGASADECMEVSVHSMEEAVNISVGVIDFCKARNIDQRRSMVAGLCVEEMVGNVVKHGFLPGEKHSVDVRIVVKEKLTIRVRDDCRAFDPQKRLEQFASDDPAKNVGIRMIARMSEEMNYQSSAGINTLLIKA